jgi:hypothetical protein
MKMCTYARSIFLGSIISSENRSPLLDSCSGEAPEPLRRGGVVLEGTQETSMRDEQGHTVETAVEARAGFLDRPVLVVLGASLVLAAVVFGLLWLGFASQT